MRKKNGSTKGNGKANGKAKAGTQKRSLFFWDDSDDLFDTFLEEIYNASIKGYSLMEIKRCLALATARPLYVLMRKHGWVPKMTRGKSPRNLQIPTGLEKALESCDISFGQWANSHELDAAATAKALGAAKDAADFVSGAAHKAFRQDFPTLYAKTYGLQPPPSRAAGDDQNTSSGYSITIEYMEATQEYRAFTHGLPGCEVTAATLDAAFFALKQRYIFYHSIRKLRLLPSRDESLNAAL